MIKQLNGRYKIRNPGLLELCLEAKKAAQLFDEVVYQHTRRDNIHITRADRLANEALSG